MEKLPIYRVSIDDQFVDGEEDLGIDLISNVAEPAIMIKGVAFSNHKKKISFQDDIKYRIAAPVMIPEDIYRNDDEEYMLRFTVEDIEILAKKFMSQLNTKQNVFNVDHTEFTTDSYILEAYLLDDEHKIKMIKDSYGIDLPFGSFFVVQQFNNKKMFEEMVLSGRTGFSLEGFLGMYLIDENDEKIKFEINKNKNKSRKMKGKNKFIAKKRVYQSISKKKFEEVAENPDLVLIADELTEGTEVAVIEDIEDGLQEDFTGEVDVVTEDGEDLSLVIEDGKIEEVITADETETETEETETEETELEEEKKEEEVEAEEDEKEEELKDEAEEVTEDDVKTDTDITEILNEIMEQIAEIKAELAELKQEDVISEVDEITEKFAFALAKRASQK